MKANATSMASYGTRTGFRTCGACCARLADEAWTSLLLARRIEAPELRAILCAWPDGYCIEVRHCGRCGHLVAAKRPRIALVASRSPEATRDNSDHQ
jgi:hypothetical protein